MTNYFLKDVFDSHCSRLSTSHPFFAFNAKTFKIHNQQNNNIEKHIETSPFRVYMCVCVHACECVFVCVGGAPGCVVSMTDICSEMESANQVQILRSL